MLGIYYMSRTESKEWATDADTQNHRIKKCRDLIRAIAVSNECSKIMDWRGELVEELSNAR